MTTRMTSKERIRQMADEAAALKEAKEAKTAKKKTAIKKEITKKRYKAVWKILDGSYREAACFPYSEKVEAYAKADKLNKKKGNDVNFYFVNEVKIPMD